MEFTAIITILGVLIANGAMIIPLFLWNRAEARADSRHTDAKLETTRELVRAIYEESKEFHRRMEKIESEHKDAMARQDAEFKAHIMQFHRKQ